MRSEDPARDTLPVSGDGKQKVQASRGTEHGAEDDGRHRARPAQCDEARTLLEVREGGTCGISERTPGVQGPVGELVM